MKIQRAIIQCADSGPLESLAYMLQSVGIEPVLPNRALRDELRGMGCDTVIDIDHLVNHWGYDQPCPMKEVGPNEMNRSDVLYVDVKAHRNGPRIWDRWQGLKSRTLWYRINGGMPEHVINKRGDHGDEVNINCPILTPNQWYAYEDIGDYDLHREAPWKGRAYTCWPPFVRKNDYQRYRPSRDWDAPVCLIHNVQGWGYERLIEPMRELGVKFHGVGAPDGLILHRDIPDLLARALCVVHLKSSDAPGYALYEALAASCPVVCTRRLIWRCRMNNLLIPDETCLVFDRETHDGLTDEDVRSCIEEVKRNCIKLMDPFFNKTIGEAGRLRLDKVTWNEEREADVASLKEFLERNFG